MKIEIVCSCGARFSLTTQMAEVGYDGLSRLDTFTATHAGCILTPPAISVITGDKD